MAHHSSYYQHWIVVPFLSPITKYTFYIYHLGEAGNSIKYNSIIAQGNWCDTQ